jgi:putative riboflavin transport system substrate-binding protein
MTPPTITAEPQEVSVSRPSRPAVLVIVALVLGLLVAGCYGSGPSGVIPSPGCGVDVIATPPEATPVVTAGCSDAPTGSAPVPSGSPSPTLAGAPVKLVVGLGYIPNVQFAPFYLAQTEGLYEAAGLEVELQNKIDADLVPLVGQGAIDVGISDGTSVIPAVSQGIPVRYIATVYGQFPSIVFAKTSSGIKAAGDLKGKKLGIPGRYGSSWVMLQALLASAGLTPDDLTIVEYPDFGQRAAVEAGAVDAATGFANNEPVLLGLTGEPVTILTIDDITPLPGPGLIAGTKTLEDKHDAIARFVAVTLDAMARVQADPQAGMNAAAKTIDGLNPDDATQRAVLDATIATWTGPVQDAGGLGAIDPAGWTASIAYLDQLGLVKDPVTVDDVVRTDLLPAHE